MTARTARLFTPKEATNTLPLVRQIAEDILDKRRALRAILAEGNRQDPSILSRARRIERDIIAHVAELRAIGCEYKSGDDLDVAVVDFPARLGGRDVYLCWQSGEETVAFYHARIDGLEGRRPIPEPWPTTNDTSTS